MGEVDSEAEKRAQARRERMIIRKGRLGEAEVDLSPVRGAEALSLVYRLTRASYSLSGTSEPAYTREQIPCKFVRWPKP